MCSTPSLSGHHLYPEKTGQSRYLVGFFFFRQVMLPIEKPEEVKNLKFLICPKAQYLLWENNIEVAVWVSLVQKIETALFEKKGGGAEKDRTDATGKKRNIGGLYDKNLRNKTTRGDSPLLFVFDIQTPPEKIFGPPKHTNNTFSGSIWMSKVCVLDWKRHKNCHVI